MLSSGGTPALLRSIPTAGRYPVALSANPYDLAIIVPTFNEADNVAAIVDVLDDALTGIRYEILFVDDWSPDGTADRVAEIAHDRLNVRVLRRWRRTGLSSAVLEGMMATMAT